MSTQPLRLQISRYVLVGLTNTLVGLMVIIGCQAVLGFSPYIANACGYAVGILVGFVANRNWVFRHSGPIGISAMLYVTMFAACYGLNLVVLWFGLHVLGWPAALAQIAGMIVYTLSFFVGCKLWVFWRA
jgi:putative flippase GtrA